MSFLENSFCRSITLCIVAILWLDIQECSYLLILRSNWLVSSIDRITLICLVTLIIIPLIIIEIICLSSILEWSLVLWSIMNFSCSSLIVLLFNCNIKLDLKIF
jgi:hypothetical protein